MGLIEVLSKRQGLLQDTQALRAEADDSLHGLLQVVHLLPNLLCVSCLGALPQHLLGIGQNISDTALLAGDVIIQGLVLLQLHSNNLRIM